MKKNQIYTIIAIAIVVGIFSFETFLNQKEKESIVKEGREIGDRTNLFFLPSSTTGVIVHHQGYSLSYSEAYEQAEWVAYELLEDQLSDVDRKRPYFEVDEAIPTGAASWRNYKNSGYDRGHLCPAADRQFDEDLFNETFLTSNISPQNHEFNSGIWNSLEQKVRYWAKSYHGVYVVTGGVLKPGLETIGSEKGAVPEYFYKIILDYNEGNPKAIAFLMPNRALGRKIKPYIVSVDSIEKLTGIDFFPKMEDRLEEEIEVKWDGAGWKF
ncbi:DNA/RNA non-specific endonuclease [Mangrovimonas sp. ST2L15]|uniref:DNA/RNA non-specific endonuclease n=1 Tax=Mangrovimonas sp. ST2L15 TaxID=1645916 RepID=UPI0006B5D0A1|nr:DNA/RNA non-specific endonuclease [Mangrovimonas sp. ST2L15]